jgi:hypothetical protein
MKANQAAKLDKEMRTAGASGTLEEETVNTILDMMREWNEFLEEQRRKYND